MTKEELRTETNQLIEEFLKTKEIKYLSRKRVKSEPPMGLIIEHKYDVSEVVV